MVRAGTEGWHARRVLAALTEVARDYGVIALFALIAVETMGIPVPGETALIAAGIFASQGHLSIEANFAHGVLEVRIPKPEERKPRRIAIKGVNGNGKHEALEGSATER